MQGVRRPDEVSRLGVSSRMMVRIGALLKKNIAISPVILESARPGSPTEDFLLSPILLERASALDAAALQELASKAGGNLPGLALATADDGLRVLCLQEELDADEWSAPQPQQPSALAPVGNQHHLANQNVAQTYSGGGPSAPFAANEIDRLRLKLATASNPTERIEALRVLSLAPLTPPDKLDVLLQALADKDPSVRAEAAGLLVMVGADRDIAEALAGLNHSDRARRESSLERLTRLAAQNARDVDIGAISVCAIATLRSDGEKLAGRLMDLLRVCAPQLARSSARVAEILRVLLTLVSTAAHSATSRELEQLAGPAYRLMYALGTAAPQNTLPVLETERGRVTDPVCEALLLQLQLDLSPVNGPDEDALLKTATGFMSRDRNEGRDSRAIGSRLLRRGEKALQSMCDAFNESTPGAQKYFLLLMDEMWRMHRLSPAALERAATLVLQCIQGGGKGLSMAASQCRFCSDQTISDGLRAKLADGYLDCVNDFIFPFDMERVEEIVSQMGLAAIDALLERMTPERPARDRIRAVRLIGALAISIKAPAGQLNRLQSGVTEALRKVQSVGFDADFPDRGELLCALGKLAACPAASKDAASMIERTLLESARSGDPKISSRALEGLTFLAASRRAQPELVAGTSVLLRKLLDGSPFDIGTEEKRINGETVIEISGGENYTSVLPLALQGLARIAGAPNCPPTITRDILSLMMTRWRQVYSGEVIWGPTNTLLLIQSLKEIGMSKSISNDLRAELLKILVPKLMQTSIMHAVTEILAADDTSLSAQNALTIGVAIFSRRGPDAQFHSEDRADILKALTRVAARKYIGSGAGDGPERARNFRRMVVEELFKGLRDSVPGCYEALITLRDRGTLPHDLKEELERRLRDYHSVVLL